MLQLMTNLRKALEGAHWALIWMTLVQWLQSTHLFSLTGKGGRAQNSSLHYSQRDESTLMCGGNCSH